MSDKPHDETIEHDYTMALGYLTSLARRLEDEKLPSTRVRWAIKSIELHRAALPVFKGEK